jgi:uncharacterized membrane protein
LRNKTKREKVFLIRVFAARPRLVISFFFGLIAGLLIPDHFAPDEVTRAIIGWNLGTCLYLVLCARMMFWSSKDKIKKQAELEDEGQALILILVIVAVTSALASIVMELATVKELHGPIRYAHIGLAVISIVTAWTFTHVIFALHYAHDYYSAIADGLPGGLDFPNDEEPDYADFLYFSFVIGTSGQTADVNFSSKHMRKTGMVHCVMAFFFNTTLLALTINIAAGLL